jgi:hypothetical protein
VKRSVQGALMVEAYFKMFYMIEEIFYRLVFDQINLENRKFDYTEISILVSSRMPRST